MAVAAEAMCVAAEAMWGRPAAGWVEILLAIIITSRNLLPPTLYT